MTPGVVTFAAPSRSTSRAADHVYTITGLALTNNNSSNSQLLRHGQRRGALRRRWIPMPPPTPCWKAPRTAPRLASPRPSTDVNAGSDLFAIGDTSGAASPSMPPPAFVTVAMAAKIISRALPARLSVTVQSSDGWGGRGRALTIRKLSINVGDVPCRRRLTPMARHSVSESAQPRARRRHSTASATDPSGPADDRFAIGDTSGRRFSINALTVVGHGCESRQDRLESTAPATLIISPCIPPTRHDHSQRSPSRPPDVAPSSLPTATARRIPSGRRRERHRGRVTLSSPTSTSGRHLFADRRHLRGGFTIIPRLRDHCPTALRTKINFETAPGHAYTVTAHARRHPPPIRRLFTLPSAIWRPRPHELTSRPTPLLRCGQRLNRRLTQSSTDVRPGRHLFAGRRHFPATAFHHQLTTGVSPSKTAPSSITKPASHNYNITVHASDGTLSQFVTSPLPYRRQRPTAADDINWSATRRGSARNGSPSASRVRVDPTDLRPTIPERQAAAGCQ